MYMCTTFNIFMIFLNVMTGELFMKVINIVLDYVPVSSGMVHLISLLFFSYRPLKDNKKNLNMKKIISIHFAKSEREHQLIYLMNKINFDFNNINYYNLIEKLQVQTNGKEEK